MKLRNKRVCGACDYLKGFPNIHCALGQSLICEKNGVMVVPKPMHPESCKEMRQFQLGENDDS